MKISTESPLPGSFAHSVDSSVCSTIFSTHQGSFIGFQHFPKVELTQASKPNKDLTKEASISSNEPSLSLIKPEEIELKVARNFSVDPRSDYLFKYTFS